MRSQVTYFENTKDKDNNTAETFRLVREQLAGSGIRKVVLASTTGASAALALDYFADAGVQLIVIPHQFDFSDRNNRFPTELTQRLREAGHAVHFGTMLFHTEKLYGSSAPSVIANFLRCFSEGVKVCYEIVLMAADAGLLHTGERVIAIAGTGLGSDTAMVMQAASTQNLQKLRINELLCKPLNEASTQL